MKSKKAPVAWLIVGIVLMLGPLFGVLGTVFGMTRAFGHLAQSSGPPDALARDVSMALYATLAGYVMLVIGIVIVVVSGPRAG